MSRQSTFEFTLKNRFYYFWCCFAAIVYFQFSSARLLLITHVLIVTFGCVAVCVCCWFVSSFSVLWLKNELAWSEQNHMFENTVWMKLLTNECTHGEQATTRSRLQIIFFFSLSLPFALSRRAHLSLNFWWIVIVAFWHKHHYKRRVKRA